MMENGLLFFKPPLRSFAASVGGDLVCHIKQFSGKARGSRMVLGSFTPPTIGYSTATASGYSFGSGHANAQTPWGFISANSYGAANSYGTSSLTTFNPGQSTYVRQDFEYPSFQQVAIVFQSKSAQINNWDNIEKNMSYEEKEFNLEDFLATLQKNYNALPPHGKSLADAIKSGHKFTDVTARQFLFNKFYTNEQKKLLNNKE